MTHALPALNPAISPVWHMLQMWRVLHLSISAASWAVYVRIISCSVFFLRGLFNLAVSNSIHRPVAQGEQAEGLMVHSTSPRQMAFNTSAWAWAASWDKWHKLPANLSSSSLLFVHVSRKGINSAVPVLKYT